MKKHRSLAAFIVICSLFVLPVSAAEEAPRIVFADAPAAAAEAVQTITRKLLIPYGVGPGAGGSDLDAVAEGYFAVESIAIPAAAPVSRCPVSSPRASALPLLSSRRLPVPHGSSLVA